MKRQVRFGVFETNSSTTHSITMVMKDVYDKWTEAEGKLYLYNDDYDSFKDCENKPVKGNLYTRDEVVAFMKQKEPDVDFDADAPNEYYESLFDMYRNEYEFIAPGDEDDCYETFEEEYTTPNGETVVAFGYYGSSY